MSVKDEKKALRAEILSARGGLDKTYTAACDREIVKKALALPESEQAATFFLYCSMGSEIDTVWLAAELLGIGKRVALPVTYGGGRMDFKLVSTMDALVPDGYGIPAPPEGSETVTPRPDDVMIVPSATYDRHGYRLGMGGGYYDRYIPAHPCVTVGMARDRLLLDAVPREAHDVPVRILITETRLLRFER